MWIHTKKINEKAQTAKFTVFARKISSAVLKTLLLDIFWWENFSGIGPWESSRPEDSKKVVLFGRASFSTGVIAAQSQHRAAKVCLSRKISDVTKKRHGHNFGFSGLKRIAGLVHHMSYLGYSFHARKIKIVTVSFFCNTSSDQIFFLNFTWLWRPITAL